ncbi:hypothetical protein [Agromyces seonyuensis]|uniref:Uncharacterized protein n=1 Tax=Agromyces seonyuensis TaxID=2662446 RepID=A0A6I4NX31_9MICO|nr:hypothetical protein [Agromyces seonyuensis]MWB98741.1 hypothetical protein [Agromyces seonyuensis]
MTATKSSASTTAAPGAARALLALRICKIAGWILIGLALALGAVAWLERRFQVALWQYLLFGDWVPTLWSLEWPAVLLGLGLLSVGALPFWPARPARPIGRRIATGVGMTVLVAVILPFSMIWTSIADHGRYRSLPERSDAGCRIVVREHSFLLGGGGSVGIVQPGSVVIDWVRDYAADDGYTPFAAGTYSLEWDGAQADLQIHGTTGMPVWWYTEDPIICAN